MHNKLRTVIFGGSFDPIHIGHTSLATEVLRQNLADEVWFMVSPRNPLKKDLHLTDEAIRLEMVRLAVAGEPRFVACDFEFNLPRPSYTYHTLQALGVAYPDRQFILLIGADNWACINRWYNYQEIISRYSIIVYPRGGEKFAQLPENVSWISSPLFDISSTEIRGQLFKDEKMQQWLPSGVYDYIITNNLYK